MKRLLACGLALLILLTCCTACGKKEEETYQLSGEMQEIALGTSLFSMEIDASFSRNVMPERWFSAGIGIVGYHYSEDLMTDISVCQWAKPKDETLMSTASAMAEECDAKIVNGNSNGIDFVYFEADKLYDADKKYPARVYVLDDGEYFVEILFWLTGGNTVKNVETYMNTLRMYAEMPTEEEGRLRIGRSSLSVSSENVFTKENPSKGEPDKTLLAHYSSDTTKTSFDIFQQIKVKETPNAPEATTFYDMIELYKSVEDQTLLTVSQKDAERYGASIEEGFINNIPLTYYYAEEERDGDVHRVVKYFVEDGDYFYALRFWLDGEFSEIEAVKIIGTLQRDGE